MENKDLKNGYNVGPLTTMHSNEKIEALCLTRATPGSSLFPRKLVLGLADAMLRCPRATLGRLGRWRVGGGLDLLGGKVQVRNSLH